MGSDTTNPYVGLRPFNHDESLLFFGRNEQTLELLQRLHEHHFVAVVGSSGCGKSSLLRAGLIPSLKAGYLVDDSDKWFISIMKPGQEPLRNLCKSLLIELYQTTDDDTVEQLVKSVEEEGADAILRLLKPLRKNKKTNYFLLIDQFEELFRFALESDNSQRRDRAIDFVNIFLELANQRELPIFVVLTMRSDFIGDCASFRGLPEAMNKSLYLVPKLNRQQLKMVIEGPAKLFGAKVNSALTSKLLNKLGSVQDELPLLQHALMRIWDHEMNVSKNGEMNLDDYKAVGGLELALSLHADEALKSLSKEEFQVAKQMFQALTTIDEHGRKTRRPLKYGDLLKIAGSSSESVDKVIQAFIKDQRSFLMIDSMAKKEENIIDISHESLIRQWSRLGRWVEEEGEAAASYFKLSQDFLLHKEGKKDLLTGTELELASGWFKSFSPTKEWANRYDNQFEDCKEYLRASEQQFEKEQRKKRNRKITYWSVISLLIVGLISFLGLWLYQTIKEVNEANKRIEEILAEADLKYQKADSLASLAENQGYNNEAVLAGLSPLEAYRQALEFVESQQAFYSNEKKEDSLGNLVYLEDKDKLKPGADALRKKILQGFNKQVERLDNRNWEEAKNRNTQKSYTDYLQAVSAYRDTTLAKYVGEARDSLTSRTLTPDSKWIQASMKNTTSSYLEYIVNVPKRLANPSLEIPTETLLKNVDSAYTRARSSANQGWLFAGRLVSEDNPDGRMDIKSIVFRVSHRKGVDSVDPLEVPQVNDILEAQSYRSTYSEFSGNAVIRRNDGRPIEKGKYVLVEDKVLIGKTLFLKVSY